MRAFWLTLAIFVALAAVLGTPSALADPFAKPASAEARKHLNLGNKLYSIRSFDEAVAEYKAGALLEAAPVFDYNLGQCFRQLGKPEEALWYYERFLSRGDPQGEVLDAVNGFVAQLKTDLEQQTRRNTPAEPPPVPPTVVAPGPASLAPVTSPPAEPWYRDGLGWGIAGAGVISTAVGGLLFLDARALDNDANANADQHNSKQQHDKASNRRLLGSIVGAGGVGLLTAGVIKLVIHPEGSARASAWNISASSHGLVVFGSF